MTLNQIEQFLAVAKYMSITKAAEELIISHSAISRSIAMLEEELGVRLINRTNKVMSLTPAGQLLVRDSQIIMQAITDMKQAVMREGSEIMDELHINMIDIDYPVLNDLCSQFIEDNPAIPLLLDFDSPKGACEMLRSGKADAIITLSFAYDQFIGKSSDFCRADLFMEDFKAVVSEKSPLASLPYLDIFALENLPRPLLIAGDDMDFPKNIVSISRFAENRIPTHLNESDASSILIRIRAGSGWAILPKYVAEQVSGCKLLDIKGTDTSHFVSLCWRNDNHSDALAEFLKLARKYFPSIPDSDDVTTPAVLLL